jgi:hypothetical protein
VIGWIGDFFRFWWSLFYWNIRKSWFRVRGAHRDDCPCQNVSDSGLALDTRCDAIIHWYRPARFRRVCPLLTETADGWRCSVEAERVRPFWARATLYLAGTMLALYLAGTVAAYVALRSARYDMGYLVVAWPPRWKELRGAQERLYATRAQQALKKGNFQEAILSLEMVCQLNPQNYSAGIALAELTQVAANPFVAEHIYERLMHDVPEQRVRTAHIWFHTLLARAAYDKIVPLAGVMLSEDPAERGAWLNALLFAARQTNDSQALGHVLQENPLLPEWCTEIINIEQALLENHLASVLPRLTRVYRQPPASYLPYYQVERLLRHGLTEQADTLLNAYGNSLQPDEAAFLRLRIYHAKKWTALVGTEFDNLLQFPMAPRIAAQFCAYLVNQPAPALVAGYCDKFLREGPLLSSQTIALYQATYLVAALADDTVRAEQVRTQLTRFTSSDARGLRGLVELLKSQKSDPRLSRILPLVPLPTEVVYAILERQPPAAPK